jgi:hypothetical protein
MKPMRGSLILVHLPSSDHPWGSLMTSGTRNLYDDFCQKFICMESDLLTRFSGWLPCIITSKDCKAPPIYRTSAVDPLQLVCLHAWDLALGVQWKDLVFTWLFAKAIFVISLLIGIVRSDKLHWQGEVEREQIKTAGLDAIRVNLTFSKTAPCSKFVCGSRRSEIRSLS